MNNAARKNDNVSMTQREWYDLKPGDVIRFATGWYEVFDAYTSGYDSVTVKLIIDDHIESYRVRTNSKATCQA